MAAHLHFVHSIAHYQLQKTSLHIKNPRRKCCIIKGFRRKALRFSILPHSNQVCTCHP